MTHGIRKSADFFFVAQSCHSLQIFFFLKDVQRLALDRFGCDHLPVLGRGLLPCRCGGQSKGMDPEGAGGLFGTWVAKMGFSDPVGWFRNPAKKLPWVYKTVKIMEQTTILNWLVESLPSTVIRIPFVSSFFFFCLFCFNHFEKFLLPKICRKMQPDF